MRAVADLLVDSTLTDEHFEWDTQKAAGNYRSHGVSFEQGQTAFSDPFSVEAIDERESYGEERVNLIGMCEGVLLHVTYTERGQGIRIISVRRAEKHEQDHYFRANAF